MPTYSFVAYAPGVISISGGSLTLSAGFNKTTDLVTISIDDDDTQLEGDSSVDEVGDDSNQFVDGTSTQIYGETRIVLSNGTVLTQIEVGSATVGYAINGTGLTPGTSYTISQFINITAASNDAYSVFTTDLVCFVAGTRIETNEGPRAVEHVTEGMAVKTLDHGFQIVRAATLQTVKALGDLAPVLIAKGTFGARKPLMLSPQHRVLIRDPCLPLIVGCKEVLCAAKHLVGLPGVTRVAAPRPVTYCHLLLDQHEIIRANGVWAESLFSPEMSGPVPDHLPRHRQTSRLCLKPYEAALLRPMPNLEAVH